MISWVRELSLIHKIATILVLGFFFSFFLLFSLISSESSKSLNVLSSTSAIERVIAVTEILEKTPQNLHREIIEASSSTDLSLTLTASPLITKSNLQSNDVTELTERLKSQGLEVAHLSLIEQPRELLNMQNMHNAMMSGKANRMHHIAFFATIDGSVQLPNGDWLNFSSGIQSDIARFPVSLFITLILIMLGTVIISVMTIYRTLKPIRNLRKSVTNFAKTREVHLVQNEGPSDLRSTVSAFNQMQTDISEFINERTRLLAAISHDLRTPLTSLRLRLEFIEESEDKKQMLKSLSIMEKMLSATLSFAKNENEREERQRTDLDSLLQSVVDEFSDKQIYIQYNSPGYLAENIPPITVRRMTENLINNAVQYGGEDCQIALSARKYAGFIEITVSDTGPGIDSSMLSEVLKPFSRVDTARSVDNSNVGLGLSITNALASNFGGELTLHPNEPSGLRCTFTISVK